MTIDLRAERVRAQVLEQLEWLGHAIERPGAGRRCGLRVDGQPMRLDIYEEVGICTGVRSGRLRIAYGDGPTIKYESEPRLGFDIPIVAERISAWAKQRKGTVRK